MPKVVCNEILCKNNDTEKKCCLKKKIELGADGCQSFEKSFHYYFNLVWQKISHTNMILLPDLTPDLRIGLCYVMDVLDLALISSGHGLWEFYILSKKDDESNTPLVYADIEKMEFNHEKMMFHLEKFNVGILPPYEPIKEKPKPKVDFQPFGYLSPDGKFFEGDWGTHEELAYNIILENGWEEEWNASGLQVTSSNYAKNFLIKQKSYVLIHDPSNFDYIVVKSGELTDKQSTFLYQYFMDMGNYRAAEQYKSFVSEGSFSNEK